MNGSINQKIYLHNTLSREKEEFSPIDESLVRVYSCGPTVYGEPHVGNFRAFMLADLLRATLVHVGGYTVKHVMNITDVGHLTDDGDQGEDKMEKGARKEGRTVWEVARNYESNFHKYLQQFNISPFDVTPRATEHIAEQITMIKTLTKKGFTYVIDGDGIYMDTSKISDYGKLAQLDTEGLSSGYRGDGAKIDSIKKRQLTDFALWKFSPKNTVRAMEWVFDGEFSGALLIDNESPKEWDGEVRKRASLEITEKNTVGFPGWHVECSAMAVKYLGEQFDIHTGGVDHIPVHHTNEIAQTECCYGIDKGVNYWIHQQFLNIDGGKMSKSKGHDLSVPGVVASGYSPLDIRYFYMTAQYSSFLDYSDDAISSARNTRANCIKKLFHFAQEKSLSFDGESEKGAFYKRLCSGVADDLNTAKSLAILHEGLSSLNSEIFFDILLFDKDILKCGFSDGIKALGSKEKISIPEEITQLAQDRLAAKAERNYDKADLIRNEIDALGWIVKDTPDGFTLESK